jgi:nucleotide-binding universal stress UspA family protein
MAGSVTLRLAAGSGCPVAVVSGPTVTEPPHHGAPVVVGVNGSPMSAAVTAVAFAAADAHHAPLVAVHSWLERDFDAELSDAVAPQRFSNEENAVLAEALASYAEKYPDVPVRQVVAYCRPAQALLEQATTAGLVVIGSRGRGAALTALLGSVSHALLGHAPCPLVIVRPEPTTPEHTTAPELTTATADPPA